MNNYEGSENNISIYEAAETLWEKHKDQDSLVLAIGDFIKDHAHKGPGARKAKDILESRFTSPEEAFQTGLLTCGSITNISAAMLRHLGFEVKLVHGEDASSVDHAWISVCTAGGKEWKEYDLSRRDGEITADHKRKGEINSWDEIHDQLISDRDTIDERRKERWGSTGMPPEKNDQN